MLFVERQTKTNITFFVTIGAMNIKKLKTLKIFNHGNNILLHPFTSLFNHIKKLKL
tara:strand:- start:426 stop:593 length:168 start_codon:yes stop_codon:yes gene_type:complete